MTYDFYSRLALMGGRMRQLSYKQVTITVDGEDVVVTASLGKSLIEEITPQTGVTIGSMRDYIVHTAELVKADTTSFLPTRGMVITDGNLICQATSAGNDTVYKYTTAGRDRIRIHTKVVQVT